MLMGNWLKKLRKNQYLKFFHHHLRHQIIYPQNHKFSVQIHQNHKSKTTSHSPHHQQQHQQISFSQLNKSEYPHHHQIETWKICWVKNYRPTRTSQDHRHKKVWFKNNNLRSMLTRMESTNILAQIIGSTTTLTTTTHNHSMKYPPPNNNKNKNQYKS